VHFARVFGASRNSIPNVPDDASDRRRIPSVNESLRRDKNVEPNSGKDPVVVGSRGARRPGTRARHARFVSWLIRRLATTAAQLMAISMAIRSAASEARTSGGRTPQRPPFRTA
jgi:hypothetical protein